MDPFDAVREDVRPIEVAGLELSGSFVGAVVENDGGAHAEAAVAIDSGHVGAGDAIVLEVLVERFDAHGADALGDEIADGVVGHGGGDGGAEAEAVREIRGDVELTAGDVDLAFGGLAEGDDSGVEAMDERAEGEEVEVGLWRDVEWIAHI